MTLNCTLIHKLNSKCMLKKPNLDERITSYDDNFCRTFKNINDGTKLHICWFIMIQKRGKHEFFSFRR